MTPDSTLQVAGGIATAYRLVRSNYAATESDSVIGFNASGSSRTITLPNAVGCKGRVYTVKKVDSLRLAQ